MKKFFKNRIFLCALFFFNLFFTQFASATVYNLVAPDTTLYLTGPQVVQTAARGFAYFTTGITFDGAVNVALPVPIMGNVQFGNAGSCTLGLETDLTFGSTAGTAINPITINTTDGVATINGNGGAINFDGDTFFPNSRAFNIIGDTTLDGRGNDLVFGTVLTFTVQSGVTLTIKNANLRNLQNLNFVGAGTVTLRNVAITLDNDWTYSGNASIGTPELHFSEFTQINGKNKRFIYAGGSNMVLESDAIVTFDSTVTLSWASLRRYGLIMDSGHASVLYFNNSNFYVPSRGLNNGLNLTNGIVMFENQCNIYNDGNTYFSKSLQFGDGISSNNNTDIYIFAGAQVGVDGYIYDATV